MKLEANLQSPEEAAIVAGSTLDNHGNNNNPNQVELIRLGEDYQKAILNQFNGNKNNENDSIGSPSGSQELSIEAPNKSNFISNNNLNSSYYDDGELCPRCLSPCDECFDAI